MRASARSAGTWSATVAALDGGGVLVFDAVGRELLRDKAERASRTVPVFATDRRSAAAARTAGGRLTRLRSLVASPPIEVPSRRRWRPCSTLRVGARRARPRRPLWEWTLVEARRREGGRCTEASSSLTDGIGGMQIAATCSMSGRGSDRGRCRGPEPNTLRPVSPSTCSATGCAIGGLRESCARCRRTGAARAIRSTRRSACRTAVGGEDRAPRHRHASPLMTAGSSVGTSTCWTCRSTA